MMFRIVGALYLAFGIVVLTFAVSNYRLTREMLDPSVVLHWTFAVTRDEYLVRSRVSEIAYGLCGAATIVGGSVMMLRRRRGMYSLTTGSVVLIIYGPLTRLLAANSYKLAGPGLDDLFFACGVAMLSALAFAVRPRQVNGQHFGPSRQ